MGSGALIFAELIVLVSSFVRAVSGFGYALLATPLLMFVMEPKSVVVLNIILASITNVVVLFPTWRYIDFRRVIFMSLGALFGVPIGAYMLSALEPSVIKLAIASLIIPFAVLLLLGHSHHFKRDIPGCGVAGFISGILSASTSLGGPPVVLFLLNQGLVTQRFVATLAAYFCFLNVLTIILFSSFGIVTTDILLRAAMLLPALFVGSFIGVKVLPRLNAPLFKKIASSIISITAIAVIVNVLTQG